ncbi:hypothetical protein BCR39DRAFT_587111 [Naematelia encephala]|uniref:Nuclear rim protein 1 n=1 Tax=Naematelia encephala TaxID=71784 RepID=A0A1Y2BBB0_9TREE|nr:hypothetical protein BCR39DRAFT_587111 [Naematelia encephala]
MSQSPLARSTRRTLPTFAHAPSRLSKSHSSRDLPDDAPSTPKENDFSTPKRSDSASRYRSAGTTPVTPTIHYSPYATSTPPGGLSRSSSIPFDMAASAKAGRKAEEEARKRSMTPVPAGSEKRLKRFVRKKPIWQKIMTFPSDLVDDILMYYPTSIEDVFPPHHLANPISLGIHFIHYLLLAPLFPSHHEPDSVLLRTTPRSGPGSRWDKWEEEGNVKGRGLGGGWTTLVLTLILLALASANSVYLFTRFRTYDLQLRSAQDPVASPHASPIPAPKAEREDEDVFGGGAPEQPDNAKIDSAKRTVHILFLIIKWSFRATLAVFGHSSNSKLPGSFTPSEDKIQSLRVWDPPEFCLAFFCAFPPSAPVLSYLLTPLHPFITPVLHLVVSFLLSHLAASFAQLVKDRMLLSAEVMREYDRRFVYKKVFSTKVDRGVGTHEAESVW